MRKLFLSAAAIAAILSGCRPDIETDMRSRDWSFKNEATVYLMNHKQDTLKRLETQLADTDYSRQLGMMYKDALTDDQGMLFIFENATPMSFYMKNTDVPLDIIYINDNKRVDSYALNAIPTDETPLPSKGDDIKYVLEVKAGSVNKWNLQEGDFIDWTIQNK